MSLRFLTMKLHSHVCYFPTRIGKPELPAPRVRHRARRNVVQVSKDSTEKEKRSAPGSDQPQSGDAGDCDHGPAKQLVHPQTSEMAEFRS